MLREEFVAVQISFPDLGVKSDIVKLCGPTDDVDKSFKHLNKMSRDLLKSNFQVKIPIFKQFHKKIIGKGGVNIDKIRDETNSRIDLPNSSTASDTIIITGKKENRGSHIT